MKHLILSVLLIGSQTLAAQDSNLIFFTEEGENFTAFVNGQKVNNEPASRTKLNGISEDFAQVKITFDTPGAPEIKSSMMIDQGKEMTSIIKKNKKGKYVMRLVSVVDAPKESASETVLVSQVSPQPVVDTPTQTTTSATTNSAPNSTVSISINAGDENFSMNVNMEEMESKNGSKSVTTTTKTTPNSHNSQIGARVDGDEIVLSDGRTFTFKYVNSNRIGPVVEMKNPVGAQVSISYDGIEAYSGEVPFVYNENDWKKSKVYFKLTVAEPAGTWSVKLKNNSSKMIIAGSDSQPSTMTTVNRSNGCSSAMSSDSFSRAKSSIENKSFSEEQMTVFKQIINNNCVSVNQVVEFINVFTYEEEKVQVAKLAYPKTVDKGNYYQINDALTYSDSIDELNDFIEKQ